MAGKSKSTSRSKTGFQIRNGGDSETPESQDLPAARRSFDDLGELPHGYNLDTIFLVAQEPHWLFTYWDIDISKHPGGAAFLRCYTGEGSLEQEIEVTFETRNWYIPVDRAGDEYYVEIGFRRGTDWNLIARSIPVTTPPEGISPSEDFNFATVPFHLSFQRMVDRVESAARSGEDLLAAISRMQRGGDFSAFGPASLPKVSGETAATLLTGILGERFLEDLASSGLSSSQIEATIRGRLEELLSSGGASEWLGSFQAGSSFGSGFSWTGGESVSSWSAAELAGILASWAGGASWTSSFTSGETTGALSSVAGSWFQALASSWSGVTSWTSETGALSSWLQSGQSSWAQSALSSWLQAGQSSWAQAALSSWGSFETSSWFAAAAAESSWGGSSENLSSFGISREFFMHVNAEVIFYGGTHPQAKVTIDGKPVTLDANGNFHFHFVFPNADYEIPIIAESPDGVETRRATLRFCRETGKVGLVTDTPQPPLSEPMGRL